MKLQKGGFRSQPGYNRYGSVSYGSAATARPTYTLPTTQPASPVLELNKGDMVEHKAFGRGMVLSVLKMGGDALLEIAFDKIGTKKLMAKTASAHMKKL